jgi:hypothetical protein
MLSVIGKSNSTEMPVKSSHNFFFNRKLKDLLKKKEIQLLQRPGHQPGAWNWKNQFPSSLSKWSGSLIVLNVRALSHVFNGRIDAQVETNGYPRGHWTILLKDMVWPFHAVNLLIGVC